MRAAILIFLCFLASAYGAEDPNVIQTKLKINGYQESMLPTLGLGSAYIPRPGGDPYVPSFTQAQVSFEYRMSPELSLIYIQRGRMIWNFDEGKSVWGYFFDPRLGVRKPLGNAQWIVNLDAFIQPGLTRTLQIQPNRLFDLGSRLSIRHLFPESRFTFGFTFELAGTFYSTSSTGADWAGVFSPMVSYQATRWLALQSWFVGFFKHRKFEPLSQWRWDVTEQPYFQTGAAFQVMPELSVSLMVNHYVGVLPSIDNLWTSLWLNYAFN